MPSFEYEINYEKEERKTSQNRYFKTTSFYKSLQLYFDNMQFTFLILYTYFLWNLLIKGSNTRSKYTPEIALIRKFWLFGTQLSGFVLNSLETHEVFQQWNCLCAECCFYLLLFNWVVHVTANAFVECSGPISLLIPHPSPTHSSCKTLTDMSLFGGLRATHWVQPLLNTNGLYRPYQEMKNCHRSANI